jgi:potassium efflux system protein
VTRTGHGTVARIRIRATTIVDGPQRLIVPNKEFITGQLINWTLSIRSSAS